MVLAPFDFFGGDLFGALDGLFVGGADDFVDGVVGLASQFLVVSEVDYLCPAGNGLDILLAQLAQEGVDVIFQLVSLHFNHPAAHGYVFGCLFVALIFGLIVVFIGGLFGFFLLGLPSGLLVLHLHVGLEGLLVGEELGALLTALEVGLLLLFFSAVLFLAHLILNS